MRHGSTLKTLQGYAHTTIFKSGWSSRLSTMETHTHTMRSMIDAAVGGTLMSKTEYEAYNLIEEMALNNYLWSNERVQPKRVEVSLILMPSLFTYHKDGCHNSKA